MNTSPTGRILSALSRMPAELACDLARDIKEAGFDRTDPPAVQDAKLERLFQRYQVDNVPQLEVCQ